MRASARKPLIRLAVMWGLLLVSLLVGYATHSVGVLTAGLAIGLIVHLALRFTVLR